MTHLTPDPIYGTTELDDFLHKTLQIPEIEEEKRRLERIKSLGLIHLAFPSATHSKWEHHLGMAHLAGQMALSTERRKRLQLLCLLGGIGHLPFTYASEHAVLIAARLSKSFRHNLERQLEEVWQMVPESGAQVPPAYRQLIDGLQVASLHAWLTALKLKRLPRTVDLGDRGTLVRERITLENELNKLYRFVARADYVQRDLYYTGLARFSLSAQAFLHKYRGSIEELFSTPASSLIDQLRVYLTDSLYFEVRSATVESLFSKKLAELLVSGAIQLADLLKWTDSQLESGIETHAGRAWWDSLAHTPHSEVCRSQVYSHRHVAHGRDTLDLECRLVGIGKNKIRSVTKYPSSKGFVVLCKSSFSLPERSVVTDVVLSVGAQPERITPIVETIFSLDGMRRQRSSARGIPRRALADDLLAYILNAPARSDLRTPSQLLASGVQTTMYGKKPMRRWPRGFWHESKYGYVDIMPNDPDYWEQFLTPAQTPKFLVEESDAVNEIVRAAMRDQKHGLPEVIETLAWISENQRLCNETAKWVLPNVVVESESGPNQIDVCSIHVKGHKTVLRFIEYTKSDSGSKAVGDLEKLEKLSSKCRSFSDLVIEPLVLGASGVREHFAPIDQLLKQFRIKAPKALRQRATEASGTIRSDKSARRG